MIRQKEKRDLYRELHTLALSHGFDLFGICDLLLEDHWKQRIDQVYREARFGDMDWLYSHYSVKRQPSIDYATGLERYRSALVFGLNYYQGEVAKKGLMRLISRYAWGRDYHKIMRKKLKRYAKRLVEILGPIDYRIAVDSYPIPEKVLALRAGLGWMGKNTNIIHPRQGSYFFLGAILTDRELPAQSSPLEDHCGRCNRCIEICPTHALTPYKLQADLCLSYITIEKKNR